MGEPESRLLPGPYRVIYELLEEERLVRVIAIGHRSTRYLPATPALTAASSRSSSCTCTAAATALRRSAAHFARPWAFSVIVRTTLAVCPPETFVAVTVTRTALRRASSSRP